MKNFRNLPKEHRKSKSKFCAIECWKSNVISLPPSKINSGKYSQFSFFWQDQKKKSTPQIEEKTWQCFLSGRLVTFFKRFKFVSIRDNKQSSHHLQGGWQLSFRSSQFYFENFNPLNTAQDSFFFSGKLTNQSQNRIFE